MVASGYDSGMGASGLSQWYGIIASGYVTRPAASGYGIGTAMSGYTALVPCL